MDEMNQTPDPLEAMGLDVDLDIEEFVSAGDVVDEMREIRRIPTMQKIAPSIKWGKQYLGWTIKKRLKYAERLASSMNHAADILQQERNNLLERVASLEEQLRKSLGTNVAQGDLMHAQVTRDNEEKQSIYRRFTRLKAGAKKMIRERDTKIQELAARVAELEAQGGDHN